MKRNKEYILEISHDDAEISSLSDRSTESEYCIRDKTGKILKRGKRPKKEALSQLSLSAPRMTGFQSSIYHKFINFHCAVFNSGDVLKLRDDVLCPSAHPEIITISRNYPKPNHPNSYASNPMGQYNYVEFAGIDDSITYCTQLFSLVPDYLLKVADIQVLSRGEVTKVVCPYSFQGTLVTTISLPSPVAENPNEYMDEARQALVEADRWAPPEGQSFQNTKTFRKHEINDLQVEIPECLPASLHPPTSEDLSNQAVQEKDRTKSPTEASTSLSDVRQMQLMQMRINIKEQSSPEQLQIKSDNSISSLSASNESSSPKSAQNLSSKARVKSSTVQSKKRRRSSGNNESGPLLKASNSLALDVPFKYTKYIAHMFNHNDVGKVITMFQMIASDSIQVTFNVYGEIDPNSGQPKNRFGRFCSLPFASREHFYRYCQVFHRAAPDAVMTVVGWNGGKTQSGKHYVVGDITYEATMLDCRPVIECEDPSCVASSSTSEDDRNALPTSAPALLDDTGPIMAFATGTVTLTFDENGKVDSILFRYRYDDNDMINRISQRINYYDKSNY